MKAKLVGALVLALILVLVLSSVAMAGTSQATINAISARIRRDRSSMM